MPKLAAGLDETLVQSLWPGRHADGNNLYLFVRGNDTRFWLFRYMIDGRAREMGLGSAAGRDPVTLLEARAKARELRAKLRQGIDPLEEKRAKREAKKSITFREAAHRYMDAHEKDWTSPDHWEDWTRTLRLYAYPQIGSVEINKITPAHVVKLLVDIWMTKHETACRVRGRIEMVLRYAYAMGWKQSNNNPAQWANNLEFLIQKPDEFTEKRSIKARAKKTKQDNGLHLLNLANAMNSIGE